MTLTLKSRYDLSPTNRSLIFPRSWGQFEYLRIAGFRWIWNRLESRLEMTRDKNDDTERYMGQLLVVCSKIPIVPFDVSIFIEIYSTESHTCNVHHIKTYAKTLSCLIQVRSWLHYRYILSVIEQGN